MDRKIHLHATGETITFTKTAADTQGEFVEMIVTLPAKVAGPPLHRHPLQTEHFVALEGKLGVVCGNDILVLEPGQSFTVPPNALHRCYTVDDAETKFQVTFTPAHSVEYLLREMYAACNQRNTKNPTVFDASYLLHQAKGEYYLANAPVFVQKLFFPVLAGFGRLLGLVKVKPKVY